MPYKNPEMRRAALRKHYESHKQYYLDRNAKRVAEFYRIVHEAKDKPCMDCGVRYPPYVMDFDHRDPGTKKFNIALVNKISSVKALIEEIAKCDVVCSNCHRERTHCPLV